MYKKLKSTCFFIIAINIFFAANFSQAKTTSTNQMNFIRCGSMVYFAITVCPDLQTAITGWTNVTYPVDATGSGNRIDVGGGNNDHADLSTFDSGTLTPGSVVNIFHKASPYTSKISFFIDGTETNPIVINGVTDASGNRPEVNCDGAKTVQPQDWSTLYGSPYGCWTLSYSRDVDYSAANDGPSWMIIKNMKMYGAEGGGTFDTNRTYVGGTSPIRVANGKHIVFEGNIFTDSDNGLFFASNYAIDHTEIRGNYFEGNGTVGSYLHHNLYLQAVSSDLTKFNIVEGNYFGPLRTGAIGMSGPKMRGTSYIMRYNSVICWQRCMDIVEAQDALPDWIYENLTAQEIIDYYRTAYVYGNQFYTKGSIQVSSPLHVGMDTTEIAPDDQTFNSSSQATAGGEPMARGHGSPVYFYHNSVYVDNNNASTYSTGLWDLDAGSGGPSRHVSQVVAANNIYQYVDTHNNDIFMAHAEDTGLITYSSVNQLHAPNVTGEIIYESTDLVEKSDITITGTLSISHISSGDPLFTDVSNADPEAVDLTLGVGSPAIGAATALDAAMASFPVLLQPITAANGGGAANRIGTTNLGAYE